MSVLTVLAVATFAAMPSFAGESCGCSGGEGHSSAAKNASESEASASKFEKDRQAILAMAGQYRVTFQFQETVGIEPGYELHEPYRAEATEMIEVLEDEGEDVDEARTGERLAVSIDGPTVGRQIDEGDELWTEIPEKHAKILEQELAVRVDDEESFVAASLVGDGHRRCIRSTTRRGTSRTASGVTSGRARRGSRSSRGARCLAASTPTATTTTCWQPATVTR